MSDKESLRRLANRVHVAIHDIQQAERLAKTFKAMRSVAARPAAIYADEVDSALGMAAVVSYARPFVTSWSDGCADKCLKPKDIQLFDGHPQHQAEHDLVIQLRDEVVAHSDWKHRFSLEGVPERGAESVRDLVVFDTRRLLTNFHSLIDLTQHVQAQLVPLLMSLERKIRDQSN